MADTGEIVFLTRKGIADPGQELRVAELAERLKKPGAKLLLHLHGGLVDEPAGNATAMRLEAAWALPAPLPPEWTRVYIVWRTGAFEELEAHWTELVHDDRLYEIVLRKLMAFVARKLGVPGAGGRSAAVVTGLSEDQIHDKLLGRDGRRAPFAGIDERIEAVPGRRGPLMVPQDDGILALEFQDVLAQDDEFNQAANDVDAHVNKEAPGRSVVAADVDGRGALSWGHLDAWVKAPIEELRPRAGTGRATPVGVAAFLIKHAGNVAYHCFQRFRMRRDHGFHATLVEEVAREMYGDFVGSKIWAMIVDDAAAHFAKGGFGATLLDALPMGKPIDVYVTAHSAGSIWASRMLLAMARAERSVAINLILLAPAVRASLFAEALATASAQVGSCRMMTMSDELERADAVLGHDKGYIYPSSLLYMVAGLFETAGRDDYPDAPVLGMQRFAGADFLTAEENQAAQRIVAFFQQPGHSITYSPTPGVTTAATHSSFSSEPLTLASVRELYLAT